MTHYYEEARSETNPQEILVQLNSDTFFLQTDNGLFSKDHLDNASKLLIESVTPKNSLLDLGCGYGVIGIALLRQNPGLATVLTDVNNRAVKTARKNVKELSLQATVKQSDTYMNIDATFSDIVTNPPLSAGKDTWYEFITQAPKHLEDEGRLSLVARHNKGGRSAEKKMKSVFGTVKTLGKSGGFRVYQSTK